MSRSFSRGGGQSRSISRGSSSISRSFGREGSGIESLIPLYRFVAWIVRTKFPEIRKR